MNQTEEKMNESDFNLKTTTGLEDTISFALGSAIFLRLFFFFNN
jgi:hypothetical protein